MTSTNYEFELRYAEEDCQFEDDVKFADTHVIIIEDAHELEYTEQLLSPYEDISFEDYAFCTEDSYFDDDQDDLTEEEQEERAERLRSDLYYWDSLMWAYRDERRAILNAKLPNTISNLILDLYVAPDDGLYM